MQFSTVYVRLIQQVGPVPVISVSHDPCVPWLDRDESTHFYSILINFAWLFYHPTGKKNEYGKKPRSDRQLYLKIVLPH